MAEVRMSLVDAAAMTKTAPNTIRSRFKSGKIRGERDNAGKIWVWLDPDVEASKNRVSKPSNEGSNAATLEALTAQLVRAQNELDTLRPKAAAVDRLEAEKALILDQLEDLRADRNAWRQLYDRRGFWGLFRR